MKTLTSRYSDTPITPKLIERLKTRVHTVGQLIHLLNKFPKELPLNGGDGVLPIWFNIGNDGPGGNGEHLSVDVNDVWDD